MLESPREQLVKSLSAAAASFADSELAFLALTSKIERPVVDRLAYRLFLTLAPAGYAVTREWPLPGGAGRVDLAVLQGDRPCLLLEAKAMYSFDSAAHSRKDREYPRRLQADLGRFSNATFPGVPIFSLLLATHPEAPLPLSPPGVFKYTSGVNAALRCATADEVRHKAEKSISAQVRSDVAASSGSFSGGSAFGVPVSILWWLFGPFEAPGRLQLLREPELAV